MFLVVDCDLKKLKIWSFQESRKGLSVKFFTEDLDELTDVANLQRYIYKISGRVNIKAISFRILFGGDYFKKAELVNSSFLRKFEKLTEFLPSLPNAYNIRITGSEMIHYDNKIFFILNMFSFSKT